MSEEPSIVCPQCQRRSFNPNDIRERYCGFCHKWHLQMRPMSKLERVAEEIVVLIGTNYDLAANPKPAN